MTKSQFFTILLLTIVSNARGQLEINGYPLNYYSDQELRSKYIDSNTHFSITDTSRYAKFYINLINKTKKKEIYNRYKGQLSLYNFLNRLAPDNDLFFFLTNYMDHIDEPHRKQNHRGKDTIGKPYLDWHRYSEFSKIHYKPKAIKSYLKGFTYINPAINSGFNTDNKNKTSYTWENHAMLFGNKNGRILFPTESFQIHDLLYSYDTSIYKRNFEYLDQINLNQLLPPFYFKNTEVTNNEYRVFVEWVRDSMAWSRLHQIDSVTYNSQPDKIDYSDTGIQKIIPEFYTHHFRNSDSIAGLDNGILIYLFNGKPIYIYSDTLCWIRDFSYSPNEFMVRKYAWHPRYDDYPIVGISWEMANAYINWLNQRLKEYQQPTDTLCLIAKLPTTIQWKQANSLMDKPLKNIYKVDWNAYSIPSAKHQDFNTFLNLDLWLPDAQVTQSYPPIFHDFNNRNQALEGDYSSLDGSLYPSTTSKKRDNFKYSLNYNKTNNISHTASNVSEWMYHGMENWMQHYELFKIMLRNNYNSTDKNIFLSIADYQDKTTLKNVKNGKLIMGANWFDERHSTINGNPISGYYAKTFKSQNYTNSTLGFRYVLFVKKKIK